MPERVPTLRELNRATLARQINMAGCSATKRVLRAAVVGAPAGGRLTGSR